MLYLPWDDVICWNCHCILEDFVFCVLRDCRRVYHIGDRLEGSSRKRSCLCKIELWVEYYPSNSR